ncbi:MAG: hypothetical protein SNJ77_03760 [Cytophagales bacterium]
MRVLIIILTSAIYLFTSSLYAQHTIGIGTDTPNEKSVLDLTSITQGFLMPRLSTAQRTAMILGLTDKGMLVYDTDLEEVVSWNGTVWVTGGTGLTGTGTATQLTFWNSATSLSSSPNLLWDNTNLRLGINNSIPNEALDLIGNIKITPTSATSGQIRMGANLFLHAAGLTNLFAGVSAGNLTLSGSQNVGLGPLALNALTSGTQNTATGANALSLNSSGQGNSAFGSQALRDNTTGSGNAAFGRDALVLNTTGYDNVAVGALSMQANTSGFENVAIGVSSLRSNTIGTSNSAFGFSSLRTNTTGVGNSAFGFSSLRNSTTSDYNSAFGTSSLRNNSTGSNNAAFAYNSLVSNTTGSENVAIGVSSMNFNTVGSENVAIGSRALSSNVAGNKAVAIGYQAMQFANNQSTAFENTNVAVGFEALRGSSTPAANTGTDNTSVGFQTLHQNTSGSYNTAIGYGALSGNLTGEENTAIGYKANVSDPGLRNATAIGANAVVGADNTVQLGNGADISFDRALIANGNAGLLGQILTSQGPGAAPIWSNASGIVGSGTTNYLARWTNSTTLDIGATQDDGTSVGIGAAPSALFGRLYVMANSGSNAIRAEASSTGANNIGLLALAGNAITSATGVQATANGTALNTYGLFATSNSTGTNSFGAMLRCIGNATNAYGLYSEVSAGTNRYSGVFMGGNVGIGTDIPLYLLHLRSSLPTQFIQAGDNLSLPNTVMGNIDFADAQTNFAQARIGVLREAASSGATDLPTAITFSTTKGGTNILTERMRINNSGFVGIGTVNPTNDLDINGGIRIRQGSPSAGRVLTAVDALGNATWQALPSYGNVSGSGVPTRLAFWDSPSSIASSPNLNWDNTLFRLGIGTATPVGALEVAGNQPNLFISHISGAITTAGADLGRIHSRDNQSTALQAGIAFTRDAASSGATDLPTAIRFTTTEDGSSTPFERMRISNNGNVGIGTTNPITSLDIRSQNVTTASSTYGNLAIFSTNTQGLNIGASISLGGNIITTTTQATFGTIEGRKANGLSGSATGYLSFKTNNAGTLSEVMRINNLGQVGIGTNTFVDLDSKLQVGNGTSETEFSINSSSSGNAFGVNFYTDGTFRSSIGYSPIPSQEWFFIYGAGGGSILRAKNDKVVIGEATTATFQTTLQNTGSMSVNVRTITGNAILGDNDYIILNKSGATAATLTLPATTATGRIIFVRNLSSQNLTISSTNQIVPHASVSPITSIILVPLSSTDDRDDAWLVFDGTNWVVLD